MRAQRIAKLVVIKTKQEIQRIAKKIVANVLKIAKKKIAKTIRIAKRSKKRNQDKTRKKIFVARKTIVVAKKQERKTKKIANVTKRVAKTTITKIIIAKTKITKNIETNNRLIALDRLIEFESINRFKSWQFESTRLESLDESISKVEIETRIRFELISRVEIEIRLKKSIRIVKR